MIGTITPKEQVMIGSVMGEESEQSLSGSISPNNKKIYGSITKTNQKIIGTMHGKDSRNVLSGAISPNNKKLYGSVSNVSGSTANYNNLYNKPSIEGVVLEGDKSFEDLNLVHLSNADLARILV